MAEARLTMINAEIRVGDGLFKSSGKVLISQDSSELMSREVMTQVHPLNNKKLFSQT